MTIKSVIVETTVHILLQNKMVVYLVQFVLEIINHIPVKNSNCLIYSDRYNTIRKIKSCLNCFGKLRLANNCKSEVTCRVCGQRYHSLLHYEIKDLTRNSTWKNTPKSSEEDNEPSAST